MYNPTSSAQGPSLLLLASTYLSSFFLFFLMPGIELRPSRLPGRRCTAELHPQPPFVFLMAPFPAGVSWVSLWLGFAFL